MHVRTSFSENCALLSLTLTTFALRWLVQSLMQRIALKTKNKPGQWKWQSWRAGYVYSPRNFSTQKVDNLD